MFGIKLDNIHHRRRLLLLAGVTALLASFPPFSFYFLVWFSLIFLFACLSITPIKKSFRYGYFFGFLFYFISLYWISYVTGAGWIFAAFFQALYVGIFGLGARFLMEPMLRSDRLRARLIFILGAAALWTLLEWVRVNLIGFGFGWNLISYSLFSFNSFIQIGELIGAYGISFLIILISSLVFSCFFDFFKIKSHRISHSIFYIALILALFFSVLSFGVKRINVSLGDGALRVGVVQGNIPQSLKWNPDVKGKIIEKYIKLSEILLYDRPDMVVWPEATYPGYLLREIKGSNVQRLIKRAAVPFLIGTPRYTEGEIYNSAVWFNKEGEPVQVYDKHNLVPFGEYIPLKKLFFFLENIAHSFGVGDFSRGTQYAVFDAPMGFKFSSLVCFENVFPNLTRKLAARGAEFFVVVTNDAWFHKSRAPYEHFYTSIFRAIETRKPFVHVANTGISGFINEKGFVTGVLKDKRGDELFISGGRTEPVFPQSGTTFYVKYGKWLPLVLVLLLLIPLGYSVRCLSKIGDCD